MSDTDTEPEGSNHPDVAEIPEHMDRHLGLLHDADIDGTDELLDECLRVWANPEDFENPDSNSLQEAFEENHALYIRHLGIVFGIEYERAYPTGRNDGWPVPLSER